jgi:serine/threonine protein kinase
MARLGRYEIVSEIGRGGMGIVYRGVDTALGRTVAIKTISLSGQGTTEEAQQLRARLIREAQAAATLSHPNIVTVHDVGQEGDNTYVVMEYVQGGTLDYVLSSPGGPRSTEAMLKLLEDVAHALDYAHAHGIVHRDVKPANIFVQENGGVKLGDFGVAKVTWSRTMTEAGTLTGSPHYMAPEQLKGERVTGRTDQFALAAVAYRLLTGRKPFDSDTFASLASKILFEEAPSPAVYGIRLGPEAEKILAKGMSKNPADRFANCTEFVDALKDAALHAAAAPQPPEQPTQTLPPQTVAPPRRGWIVGAGIAVLALVIAAGMFYWLRPPRAERTESARTGSSAGSTKDISVQPNDRADIKKSADTRLIETKADTTPADIGRIEKKLTSKTSGAGLLRALGQRLSPKDGLVYVRVPAGRFRMGCVAASGQPPCEELELPAHDVILTKDFWIGQTEVTVEAYQHFAQATGTGMPPPPGGESYWREPKQPMLNVTWEEAGAYCKWAGGRLPTEAEWEYAARAGTPGPYYGKPDDIAWYSGDRGTGNSDYQPHPVGQKAPNALGLHDMHGNAQEWVRETLEPYDANEATDPAGTAAGSNHVMRGGGFSASLRSLRVYFRYRGSSRSSEYGLRCVLPAE